MSEGAEAKPEALLAKEGPDVSVLIAAYNATDSVHRAIDSALDPSQGVRVEVIVADDASTDATAETVAKRAETEPRLTLLRLTENGGPGAARRAALSAASGDWVAVLDADDVFLPGRLARLTTTAAERDLDLIIDNLALRDPADDPGSAPAADLPSAFPLARGECTAIDPHRFALNAIPGGRVNLGWSKPLIRRAFLTEHGVAWSDLRHGEDFLFAMEVLLAGARAALIGEPGYLYHLRRSRRSHARAAQSRTVTSLDDQLRVAQILSQHPEVAASPALAQRFRALPGEIRAAGAVLEAMDRRAAGRQLAAAASLLGVLPRPLALARCLAARFGPGSRRIR
ncbi:MAG: glycosyltransferase family 2 protein [Pseudomonadota bacterium]